MQGSGRPFRGNRDVNSICVGHDGDVVENRLVVHEGAGCFISMDSYGCEGSDGSV